MCTGKGTLWVQKVVWQKGWTTGTVGGGSLYVEPTWEQKAANVRVPCETCGGSLRRGQDPGDYLVGEHSYQFTGDMGRGVPADLSDLYAALGSLANLTLKIDPADKRTPVIRFAAECVIEKAALDQEWYVSELGKLFPPRPKAGDSLVFVGQVADLQAVKDGSYFLVRLNKTESFVAVFLRGESRIVKGQNVFATGVVASVDDVMPLVSAAGMFPLHAVDPMLVTTSTMRSVPLAEGAPATRPGDLAAKPLGPTTKPVLAAKSVVPATTTAPAAGIAKVEFYGSASRQDAYFVIYVIDRSGSMVGSFDEVRMQAKGSISRLSPRQQFHVIVFSHDKFEEIQPKRLVYATEENKQLAFKSLDRMQATGFGSSPIPALEVAFRALRSTQDKRGKLCYILTDGEFASSGFQYRDPAGKVMLGNQAVIGWLRANNKDQSIHMYPIILGPPPNADTEGAMKLLAGENAGLYRYVSNREE
jgi:hypothetical protein